MRSRRSLARSSTGGGGALNKSSSEASSGVRFENVDEVDDAMRLCEDYHVLLASIKTQSSEASSLKGNDSSAIFSDIQSEVDNSNSLDAGPPLQPPVSARSNASDLSSSHSPKSNSTTAILPTPPKVDSNGVSPRAMRGVADKPTFEEPLPPVLGEADLTSVETAPLRVVPLGDDSCSQHHVSNTSDGTVAAVAKQESPKALSDGHRVGSFNTNTWGHLVQALQAKHLRSARTAEHQRSVHELCKVIRDLGLLASGLVTTVETMEARQRAQEGQLHVDGMGSDDDIQSLISNEDVDERDMGGDAETRDRVPKPPLAPRRVSPTNESISNSMTSPPAVNLPPALQGFIRPAQASGSNSPAEPQSLSFPTSQNVSGAPSPSSRRRSVHFKKTGAFGEDEPEALDLAHLGAETAAAGMTQTIVRLLHRKSVTVHNQVRRTTDATGYEMVNDFLILEELGRGATGTVFFVLDTRTSREFAMKEIKRAKFQQMDSGGGSIGSNAVSPRVAKSPGTPNGMLSAGDLNSAGALATALISAQPSSFNREVAIMKKLRHKNICTLHEVIDDPKSNSIFLIMDLVSGGRIAPDLDLATGKCTPVPFTRVRKYVGQIAQGLHYLHRHGIAHRDLKPDNILLTEEDDVVLVDFGVSMEGDRDGFVKGFAGTPAFVAPEVWSTDSGRAVDGNSADMWSLGVTIYMMLFGCSPFVAPNTFQLQRMIEESPVEFPDDFDRRHWKDLITRLMAKSPSDRIKVDEVKIHPALDPDLDESLEGFTVQPTEEEMVFAISGRRTSVTPDCESMRRVSQTMEQPGSMLPTVTLRKASLAAGASGSPKEEPFREAHSDLSNTLPPISGRRGKQ